MSFIVTFRASLRAPVAVRRRLPASDQTELLERLRVGMAKFYPPTTD